MMCLQSKSISIALVKSACISDNINIWKDIVIIDNDFNIVRETCKEGI